MILPALEEGGYTFQGQVVVGLRPGGGRHLIDALVTNSNEEAFLISLKWQQSSGTAEQKVPFELICLADAISKNRSVYKKAYLVLGGNGWKLRDFYVQGGLESFLAPEYRALVDVLTLEDFIAHANKGRL